MDLHRLGDRIRTYRQRRSLRQSDVASALQISAQAVSKWERGENAPDISILLELARLLGITVDHLLGGHEPNRDTFKATVLATSINGFAERAFKMAPKDVAVFANNVFYPLTEAVLQFDGIPVKYVGDGFLAFFAGARQEERAYLAALEARKLLDTFEVIISLNQGHIFLGTIGHPDYSSSDIIGEPVNTVFLAMDWIARNCSTGLGILQELAEPLSERYTLRESGEVNLTGHQAPMKIFEPPHE